jgi:hypothetical protein
MRPSAAGRSSLVRKSPGISSATALPYRRDSIWTRSFAPPGGKRIYLWRAVDDEGEVLYAVVQKRRDTEVALKPLRRLLCNQSVETDTITKDGLYGAALKELSLEGLHRLGHLR